MDGRSTHPDDLLDERAAMLLADGLRHSLQTIAWARGRVMRSSRQRLLRQGFSKREVDIAQRPFYLGETQ